MGRGGRRQRREPITSVSACSEETWSGVGSVAFVGLVSAWPFALNRLAPPVQAAFILHRRDGLSFDEIGEQRRLVLFHAIFRLAQL